MVEGKCTYVCIYTYVSHIIFHVHAYIHICTYIAAADTSSSQSQQAANLMPQYMQALNQMGTEWLSALSNATGNSGLFYIIM